MDIMVIISAVITVTAILRLFFKKKITAFAIAAFLVIGTAYIIDRSHYTTFIDLYSDHLNKDSVIRSITVSTAYLPDERRFDPEEDIEIEEEKIMNEIIQAFSELELKKDRDHHYIENPDYRVRITTTNEEEEGLLRTESFYFNLNDKYLNNYKVVNDSNHIEMLAALVENEHE